MKRLFLSATTVLAAASCWAWNNSATEPMPIFPAGTVEYGCETKTCPDGTVWSVIYHPNLQNASGEEDISNVVYEYRLQHFDINGNPTFAPEGLLLSDYNNLSYTVVNQYLTTDADGNAIVAVIDNRNSSSSGRSYTAYKVSPTGQMLWGEDGVPISDPANPAAMAAGMKMVQLEDGSTVFAWMEFGHQSMASNIHMQRISAEGEALWDPATMGVLDEVSGNPYMVYSGDNTFILVYARTASNILYARKLDFECESVWGKDVRIYRGGWGNAPLHTVLNVAPSGNGGVLVSWCDDRANTRLESAYLSYVTPNGKLGFAGASDEGDVKLSYADWRNFNVNACAANDGTGFYVTFRATDMDQRFQGVLAQKVDMQGELLWGDDAVEVEPIGKDKSFGFITIQPAPAGDMCVFFQEYINWFNQPCYAARVNGEGERVWSTGRVALSADGRGAGGLEGQPMPGLDAWLCTWSDNGSSETDKESTNYMTLLNADGTLGSGNSGLCNVNAEKPLRYAAGRLTGPMPDGTSVAVYTPAGQKAATAVFSNGSARFSLPAGFYVANIDGQSCKFAVK